MVQSQIKGYFFSPPNYNSVWKYFPFVCGSFFEPERFPLDISERRRCKASHKEKPEGSAVIPGHLARMSLWVFMRCKNMLDAWNDTCVPLLLGDLRPDPTRCQEKRLTTSMVPPRRGTAIPTSQLKSKFKTRCSRVSSLSFAYTACWLPPAHACL